MTRHNPFSVAVSPDLEAYAFGSIDITQVRCALCRLAPCACPPFGTPAYLALLDAVHGRTRTPATEPADAEPADVEVVDLLTDTGGYLPCGCHGSQRDHTCGPLD